jgi:hypothetical protein
MERILLLLHLAERQRRDGELLSNPNDEKKRGEEEEN